MTECSRLNAVRSKKMSILRKKFVYIGTVLNIQMRSRDELLYISTYLSEENYRKQIDDCS